VIMLIGMAELNSGEWRSYSSDEDIERKGQRALLACCIIFLSMKTYILQLEKFDNLASTREKMHWAKARRILLVWPKRGKPYLSAADIGSIQHEAARLGLEIAFVCKNGFVQDIAGDLSISVFSSVPQAEKAHWKKIVSIHGKKIERTYANLIAARPQGQKVKAKPFYYIKKWVSIILAGLAILSLILFFVPHATIILHPKITEKTITINVFASPEIESVNVNGNLPASLQTIELTKTGSSQSTGKTQLASQYAGGEVIFTNISAQTVTIPANTIVLSSSNEEVQFATQLDYTLEAGETSAPIEVKAIKAGISGNVPAGDIDSIDGALALVLQVTNEFPTSGGKDVEAPSPTEEDYDQLKAKLVNELRQEIITQFKQGETRLIEATLDNGKVVSETRSVDPGTASDIFSLTINVEFTFLTYSDANLQKLVNDAMTASLESGTRIYGNGVTIDEATYASVDNMGARWVITAVANTGVIINEDQITRMITGKNLKEAKDALNSIIENRQDPIFVISPQGWNWLPWFSMNMRLEVE
jgi:hypothetical protein